MANAAHAAQRTTATVDFGFDPARSSHHFAVSPVGGARVQFIERFAYGEVQEGDPDAPNDVLKAELDIERWRRIHDDAAEVFNARLRAEGYRAGAWRKSESTLLAPRFGRELILLVWATEGQDLSVLPAVRLNWRGFAPEERWWLYSTINASSRHPEHAERGWRRAIKIAFAENPVDTSGFLTEPRAAAPRPRGRKAPNAAPQQPSLLGEETTQQPLLSKPAPKKGAFDDIY